MALETLFMNPNPPVSRSKSVLSRFMNPLSKHSRNLADFFIEPEDPWKTYSPADIVKGNVVLVVARGFDLTHLVVSLHGFAKVYKHRVIPGEGVPAAEIFANGKGSRGFEYHGNGLASLFEDEIVLCGSGFLKKQIYKFGFELQFPVKSLPTSIDFERGTISYIISATLTRPTAIAPTVSVYKPVTFQDSIEIEHIPAAPEQFISLEPISKRGKPRKVKITPNVGKGTPQVPLGRLEPPLSPTLSEETAVTANSTSTQSFQVVEHTQNGSTPTQHTVSRRTSDTRSSQTSLSSQTITARASVLRQAALPGDTVPISISVSHVKPNVRGVVIATLYRQGRVDMHPAIPLGSNVNGKIAEYEDIYPRSKTGLGGLYFSTGSPNSVFRMDLSQSSTMMVIDPKTLTAEVKTSIRIPDDAFPTITSVPGGMIDFSYYVEIVVDLCGKLGETRFLPRLTSSEPTFTQAAENGNQMTSAWADSILDTAQLRRTRSVVDFTFMILLGTKDSSRSARKAREAQIMADQRASEESQAQYPDDGEWDQMEHQYYDYQYDGYDEHDDSEGYMTYGEYQPSPAHIIPPPQAEEAADEKTVLRQQEQLLLPSQPPQDPDSSGARESYAPTAPVFPQDGSPSDSVMPGPSHNGASYGPSSTHSMDTIVQGAGSAHEPPSFESLPEHVTSGEDKQELERERLLAQASAPPGEDDETGPANNISHDSGPTAPPVLDDDEDYIARTLHREHSANEHLPQYER
jgi:arrestin-related trafficking adapter 9